MDRTIPRSACIPMMALTGKPTEAQLRRMLTYYLDSGIRSVMLYPRTGCEIAYLSEEWRRDCEFCIRFAAEHDMEIWLYDEYNWPSGSCGGRVTQEDEAFAARRMVADGDSVTVEVVPDDDAHPFRTDLLNPTAVRRFIDLTHETYYRWFAPWFGTVIRGIFTDEPSFCYSLSADNQYAYYTGLREDYRARTDRELFDDVAAYHRSKTDDTFALIYRQLLGERFCKAYVRQLADWCDAHGILLCGHTMDDSRIPDSIRCSGDILRVLGALSVPGIDEITTGYENDALLFAQLQQTRTAGKAEAMAELFALGPCSLPTARKRQIIWHAAAFGINRFFLAVSPLDGRANDRKNNFFHAFSPFSPDCRALTALAATAEEAAVYADKTPHISISLRYPLSVCAVGLENGNADRCATLLYDTMDALSERQLPWRLIAEDQESETAVTLSFSAEKICTQAGDCFDNAADCAAFLDKTVPRPITVTERSGEPATGLLVRSYTDGSYLIVDLANEEHGERTLCVNGTREIVLPCFGVLTNRTPEIAFTDSGIAIEHVRLVTDHAAVARSELDADGVWTLTVRDPLEVRLSAREEPVWLDETAVALCDRCEALTDFFNPLYRSCAPLTLMPGVHRIRTTATDFPYLPALVLSGAFDCRDSVFSAPPPQRNSAEAVSFFGSAAVRFEVSLPHDAHGLYLTLADTRLFCVLTMEGEEIAAQAYAPYRFAVPTHLAGKTVHCELRFFSSFAPLFGDPAVTGIPLWHLPSRPETLCVRDLKLQQAHS